MSVQYVNPTAIRTAAPVRPVICRPNGFSLVELSIAIALSAVVMLALGSAIVLASRALPDADSPALTSQNVGRILEQFSTDLQHALYVSERSPHAITFTVADRTGDGSPQRIRYAWSGSAGDPLMWQLDDHDPVPVLAAVDAFDLDDEQFTRVETYPGFPIQGSERLVSFHSLPGSSDRDDTTVTSSNWAGQLVSPALPSDTLHWEPTFAEYRGRLPTLLASSHWVQLVVPNLEGTPTSMVLAHRTQSGSLLSLSWFRWLEAHFSSPPRLMPGQPVQLIFRHPGSGLAAIDVEFDTNASSGGMTRTTNGQNSWEAVHNNRAIVHNLHAIPYTAGPDQTLTRTHLHRLHFKLKASGDNTLPVSSAVHLPNRPALLSRYWEADFRHDPTAIDVNADGEPDWRVNSGATFTGNDLKSNGVWQAKQVLRTWPDDRFNEPTTVHVRMRHTSATAGGALALLHADRSSSLVGPVGVLVQLQSDGQQTVTLFTLDSNHYLVGLASFPGYHAGFLDIRMLVSPAQRSVHLRIEGVDRGTYRYNRIGNSSTNQAVNLLGWQTDQVEFEHVRVMVGGTP